MKSPWLCLGHASFHPLLLTLWPYYYRQHYTAVLGMEPRASRTLGKRSDTEPLFQALHCFIKNPLMTLFSLEQRCALGMLVFQDVKAFGL